MSIRFLTEEYQENYGRYVGEPTTLQLARYFHLDDLALQLVKKRRGDHNRLGFAVQLGTVRFLGTFLNNPLDVPTNVVNYLASQLKITESNCLSQYLNRIRTHWEHIEEIKYHYGYRDFNSQPEHWRLVRWLYERAWVSAESPSVLFDITTAQLLENKILLPGVTILARLIASVRERVEQRLYFQLSKLPNQEQIQQLESLLIVTETSRPTLLEQWRTSATRISSPALVNALKKLENIRALDIGKLNVSQIPPIRLKALAKTAFTVKVQAIARMPEAKRIATLVALIYVLEATAIDDALDILESLVKDLLSKSEREGKKERLRTLKDLDAAALELARVGKILLDENCDEGHVREQVWSFISKDKLAQVVERVEKLARLPEDNYYQELLNKWRTVRIFLPTLLRVVEFESNKAGKPILEAWQFLQALEGQRQSKISNAPLKMIDKNWLSWVVRKDGSIDRKSYTFSILEKLIEGLRCRDLFVNKSERWSNPSAKLLQGQAWESARSHVCRALNLNLSATPELEKLKQQLDEAYHRTANNLPNNGAVKIETVKGKETLTITNLDKLDELDSYLQLKEQVQTLLPHVDLPEVLLEMQVKTGFLDEFTHINESFARVKDLSTSICAILVANACNISLTPLERPNIPALTRSRLNWVEQNYMRPETLILANARLVDAQSLISIARSWGGGEVASADGLRFVVPVRTVNAGANSKYFGQGRGITYYNFTSDQFTGFHGLVIPGTLRDSLFVLVGLLEQQTSLRPKELMTDTSGYSDVVFGLFWLLGYQFSPRLADAGEARFWKLNSDSDYGVLEKLARQRVKPELIEQNWDDLLRIAGSLKLGTVSASEIMRTLQKGKKPSTLAKAIGELGRVSKTLYLLNYVDDEAYRRRILTQLNRGESRHSLSRAVFYGRRGEVRQRYREGQEEQLGALGLVVNAIVLWNTYYMDAALNHLRLGQMAINAEDVARLSPLGYEHINILGRYRFHLEEDLKNGAMRPLRNRGQLGELDDWSL
ncbi:MAG: Tn3 family transposase [Dolichospermum sp.]|jgi:TnpA family transposase|uniref:Tn3 family transposase n=1 Tax=Planktothrix agardhii TaxID=1160 RepID=UPI001F31856A|nr:Tn3 family transposase [Planktothrix agardhii]MCF3578770.1 Tn3 family transposase [Planktothrix agardhii 1812]MCF3583460.1 Tn3 family transposase [Planktothrix agardhii 1811]MCF3627363.1 Tn3 family transposase [Planktothrix agardhii 1801]MCF3627396.1 Tn3 family transposase [Planktothrix agardhii 1801]CAD5983138.1 Transposase for transposon gamma-delta [Planktothrix agardhii]